MKKPMNAAEWAEANVILKDTGRFKYDVTPFLRAPTAYASDLIHTCRVILKTPAQVGKSQAIQNIIGWMAEFDPANSLIIMDSMKTGMRFSKNRLKPFLRDICHIAAFNTRSKDKSKETANLSLGTGANLIIGSALSASDLCSTPVKWLFADELDRWPDEVRNEGDPLLLAFKRQLRFMGMAVLTSTPTNPEGRITQHYKLGTQEVWCAVCECGEYMRVSYDDIIWESTPTYHCPKCGVVYDETAIKALKHDYAPPANSAPFTDKYGRLARSFEITATLCHNQYSWDTLKREEMQALSLGEAAVRSFRNTSLGETYTPPEQEYISPVALVNLADSFDDQCVPDWVDVIVCGIDTQDRAFPHVVCGVSRDLKKIAIIHASMILGDLHSKQPWKDLKYFLSSYRVKTASGQVKGITMAAIDSGGHFTQDIYALSMLSSRIIAVKGRSKKMDEHEKSIIDHVSRIKVSTVGSGIGRTNLYFVNTHFCKDLIYDHLRSKLNGLPLGDDWVWAGEGCGIDENFFEQVTSETKCITSTGYYYAHLSGAENHYLDCMVYSLVAAETYRLALGHIPALDIQTPKEKRISERENGNDKPKPSSEDPGVVTDNPVIKSVIPKVKRIAPVKKKLNPL
jgi:phage terminase large subunit GpA-like protein